MPTSSKGARHHWKKHCARVSTRQGSGGPLDAKIVTLPKDDIAVFCPEELLNNTITHLLENAGGTKHRKPGHETETVCLEISVSMEDSVRVAFRNDGTEPIAPTGKGIASMRRKLLDFDGRLTPMPPSGRWSYEIELRLPLWAAQPWKE